MCLSRFSPNVAISRAERLEAYGHSEAETRATEGYNIINKSLD